MPSSARRSLSLGAGLIVLMATGAFEHSTVLSAQNDLDAFMKEVVARRDDNWKKLQQYVLDEHEVLDLRGPGNVRMWGEEREYTWFIRDGFFVRSPLRFNGVIISEEERRKAEDEYLRRAQRRDQRAAAREAEVAADSAADSAPAAPAAGTGGTGAGTGAGTDGNTGSAPDRETDTLTNVDGLIRQTRQPQFISSAYFLRFRFDEGTYALVGREAFEGRDVLKIEYYPTKLYSNDRGGRGNQRGRGSESDDRHNRQEAEFRRVLNKVALVTLWIEPASHQIVKYTFDNIDFDFLPGRWLVHVDTVRASMTMSQPFKDTWLPRGIEVNVGLTLATGEITIHETTGYHDYREATVTSKVGIPGAKPTPGRR